MRIGDKDYTSVFIGFMVRGIRRGTLKAVTLELLREGGMDRSMVPRSGLR